MKTLFLIRHAKSSWDNPALDDFDRPLNKRGLKDAPFMAALIEAKNYIPDKIVSSPANRAITTARYFANAFNIPSEKILLNESIYEAYPDTLSKIIHQLDDAWDTVFLFGHNPGFTELANRYSNAFISNIPTCGIVRIMANVEEWENFVPGKARVTDMFTPKEFQK
ncbi:MAG: histidine phosphatase family protein [Saprospiraceae bacterium]